MTKTPLPWCRLYAEARRDKKLSILSLAERGVWVNLLCYASEQDGRGAFDASDRFVLALECSEGDEDVLNSTLEKLLRVKHITLRDDGFMEFRTFVSRQYDKPSDTPEATRSRQEKHRHAVSRDVTPQEREGEEDREEELDQETNVTSKEREISNGVLGRADAPTNGKSSLVIDVEEVAHVAGFESYNADALRRALEQYHSRAPNSDVFIQIARMQEWLAEPAQQKKHRKMSYRFFTNWLEKAAEKPYGNGYSTTIEASSETRRPRKYLR